MIPKDVQNIKFISKFTFQDFFSEEKSLSWDFWNYILDEEILTRFILNKYIPFLKIKGTYTQEIYDEIHFFLSQLYQVKKRINIIKKNNFKVSDLYFAYVTFSKIVGYYNDYYISSWVNILLSKWLNFWKIDDTQNKTRNLELEELKSLFLNDNNEFVSEIIIPLFQKYIHSNTKMYSLQLFFPNEIVLAMIFSHIITNKNTHILLNVSETFEQFDCTEWIYFFDMKGKILSTYFDSFLVYRDFWKSISDLTNAVLKWENYQDIPNVWFFINDTVIYNASENQWELDEDLVSKFIEANINEKNIHQLFWENFLRVRFFPYKCYYNKCNFCTINSQNLFGFSPKYWYDFFINVWIDFIKKYDVKHLNFKDEAVPPVQIINFAKRVLENNLDITYQFRTRFDKMYTKDVCELLYKSWARYCGIWLESASERINEDIANKWERHITLQDKFVIIQNFDSSKIRIQNFAIIGFPTETKLETIATYNFIIQTIKNSNFYTSGINLFWLMKGSYIFENREKYWIKIDEKILNNPLNLDFDFNYDNWEKRNLDLYKKVIENVHLEQTCPWLKWRNWVIATSFWQFIEKTNYFYVLKRLNDKNPFVLFSLINDNLKDTPLEKIISLNFSISRGLYITKTSGNLMNVYDYIQHKDYILPSSYEKFLELYNDDISLLQNLEEYNLEINNEIVSFLIDNKILIHREYEIQI